MSTVEEILCFNRKVSLDSDFLLLIFIDKVQIIGKLKHFSATLDGRGATAGPGGVRVGWRYRSGPIPAVRDSDWGRGRLTPEEQRGQKGVFM